MAAVAVGLAAGMALGTLFWSHLAAQALELEGLNGRELAAEVVSDAASGAYGDRSKAAARGCVRALRSRPRGRGSTRRRRARSSTARLRFRVGARDEWARRRHRAGVAATASAKTLRVRGWSRGLRGAVGPWREGAWSRVRAIPSEGSALVAGVVLGHREDLTGTEAESDFRTTGLTHLVAVSGSHLVVVAALVAWLLGRLRMPRVGVVAVDRGCRGTLRHRERRAAIGRACVADGGVRGHCDDDGPQGGFGRGPVRGGVLRVGHVSPRRVRHGLPALSSGCRGSDRVLATGRRVAGVCVVRTASRAVGTACPHADRPSRNDAARRRGVRVALACCPAVEPAGRAAGLCRAGARACGSGHGRRLAGRLAGVARRCLRDGGCRAGRRRPAGGDAVCLHTVEWIRARGMLGRAGGSLSSYGSCGPRLGRCTPGSASRRGW